MRNKSLLMLLLVVAVPLSIYSQAKQKKYVVKVVNSSNHDKTDNPVVISLNDIKCDFKIKSAVVLKGNQEIVSQLDDLNQDAKYDELAFVTDMAANSKENFTVLFSSEKSTKVYKARTFAEMMAYNGKGKLAYITSFSAKGDENVYSFTHHHGPAFESELVAYRVYFNEKQTIDPYGKFNKGLEINATKFYPTDEQLKAGYGDDVLRVNNSCGIGAFKGWDGSNATHIQPVIEREERIISSGPVRSIAQAKVIGWEYKGNEYNMINRYTLYAGHRDIVIDVIFDEKLGNVNFSSGVQKLKENSSMFSDHKGLVGSWGTDFPVNDTIKYAKETVGIGTFIPKQICGKEHADKENYLYEISAPGKSSLRYYTTFTSKKESFGFKDDKEWYYYLKIWKSELETPCTVEVKAL